MVRQKERHEFGWQLEKIKIITYDTRPLHFSLTDPLHLFFPALSFQDTRHHFLMLFLVSSAQRHRVLSHVSVLGTAKFSRSQCSGPQVTL